MLEFTAPSFYVATDGDDAWSGTLPATSADKTDGPFKTLDRARLAVRALKPHDPTDNTATIRHLQRFDVIVEIRGGVYRLDKTVAFDVEDSAHWYKRVVYKAHGDEKPVFTSACPIEGWRPTAEPVNAAAAGKVWEADLPDAVGLCTSMFDGAGLLPRSRSELFFPGPENSHESVQAREPLPPTGNPNIDELDDNAKRRYVFRYPEGFIKNWDNLRDVELYSRPRSSTMNLLPLSYVDESTRTACVSVHGTVPFSSFGRKPTVAVENRIEYISGEGQWAVDTLKKKVYLWPRTSGPRASGSGAQPIGVYAPTLKELIRVEGVGDTVGSNDAPASGIMFRGLTFTCAKRDTWTTRDASMQHDWGMLDKADALVRFKNARRCGVEDCVFTLSGGSGIRFDNYAQHCFVIGCELSYLGQSGVDILGYGPGTKDVNMQNSVINNVIHDLGLLYHHGNGVNIFQSGENRIAHNHIYNMPRVAICLNGVRYQYYSNPALREQREFGKCMRWNEIELPVFKWEDVIKYTHSRNNLIEYNNVEHCLKMLSDGSSINASGCGPGNIFRRNYVHHIYSAPGEGLAGAVRTDDDQLDTYLVENVIAHTNCAAYEFKRQNYFNNNIIYDVDPDRMMAYTTKWGMPGRGSFEKNIYIDIFGDSYVFGNIYELAEASTMIIDNNMYFRYTGDRCVPRSDHHFYKVWGRADRRLPLDEDLDVLRNIGHDTSSTYGVDPLLVDPANDDFRLSENSPARAMGIVSLDIRQTGPQGKYKRK
ncbi:MAG: right-handed parallel beta-helix repeat-containing protein [Oscillospiraceae bacterium]|nr:right-handed parallel beta-helix repeat-containing protein [Oscillospiraceae bacterium]